MNWKLVLVLSASWMVPAGVDAASCNADAEMTAQMASEANRNNRLEEAVKLYSTAAEACGRFEYWIAAADILAKDPLKGPAFSESGAQEDAAVDTYLKAYQSAQLEEQFARAAQGIASVGQRSDPTNAQRWLINAKDWGAAGPDLNTLEARVDQAAAKMSKAEIEAGLGTRGPRNAGSILWSVEAIKLPGSTPVQVAQEGPRPIPTGVGVASTTIAPKPGPSINLPLNFVTGSTTLDGLTAGNVERLAEVLAENYPGKSILFVGHADVRGDPDMNRWLSKQRALAVRTTVEQLQPGLQGQIKAEGRGADIPLDPGTSEAAYRKNRRLEVIIVK